MLPSGTGVRAGTTTLPIAALAFALQLPLLALIIVQGQLLLGVVWLLAVFATGFALHWHGRRTITSTAFIIDVMASHVLQVCPVSITISELHSSIVLDANPAAYKVTGYPRERLVGGDVLRLGLYKDVGDRSTLLERLLRDGRVENQPITFIMADGSVRQGLRSAELIEIGGRMYKVFFTVDVTDYEQTRLALARATAEKNAIVNVFPDLYFRLDAAGHYVEYLGGQWKGGFLRDPNTLSGLHIREVLPAPAAAIWVDTLAQALATGEVIASDYGIEIDGKIRFREVRMVKLAENDVLAITRDITERKVAEAELNERNQLFGQVADNISEAIFIRDLETKELVYLSKPYEAIWGRPMAERLAVPAGAFPSIHPDDQPRAREVLQAQERGETGEFEYRIVRPDGEVRWLRSRTFPIRREDGTIYRIVGLVADITDRRQLERDLLETERLRSELEREQAVDQLKQDVISTISHEFRTPLAVILSSAELIQNYFDRLTPERRETHVNRIRSQITQMTRMMEDILELNRARAGFAHFQPVSSDLAILCRHIIDDLQADATFAQHITFTVSGDLDQVEVDERLIGHVLTNLLTNAAKYSDRDSDIEVTLRREADSAILTVTDHGIGIPLDEQDKLFAPFYRASNVGNRRGTGLGLAIVRNSVQIHGGRVALRSMPGDGTTVTVALPITQRETI